MQRFLPLFLLLIIPALSSAQDIPTTQKPLITKITATWCSNCGSWGWNFFHDIIEANPADAIYVAAHPSGDLVSPEGQDFSSNFGANGQPKFYFNNSLLGLNSGNGATIASQVSNDLATTAGQSPIVGTGIQVVRDGDSYTATTNTKFFSATEGEYHLAIYVIEDKVIANQQSQGPAASHSFILRTSFGGSTFGEAIATGTIEAGKEVQKTLTITANDNWVTGNLYFAAVVWKKVDGTFEYVNGNQVAETFVNSDEEADYAAFQMNWLQNDTSPLLDLNADKNYQDLNLEIFSIDGRLVHSEKIEFLAKGKSIRTLALDQLPGGSYAVKLSSPQLQKSILLVK